MGYEMSMQADIVSLLQLFGDRVPDVETNAWVLELASDYKKWRHGHEVFDRIRTRYLEASKTHDHRRECQYRFEEVCLKSLYNETRPSAPFDARSPYGIIKNALVLARAVGVPTESIVDIVAPDR